MRYILLREVAAPDFKEAKLDYKNQLLVVVEAPKASGITIGEMEKAREIRLALNEKKPGDILAIEANHHALLCQWIESAAFHKPSDALIQFRDDIKNAPTSETEAKRQAEEFELVGAADCASSAGE